MVDLFESVWQLHFSLLQAVFNIDYFLGSYVGLLVVVFSTVFMLVYILKLAR